MTKLLFFLGLLLLLHQLERLENYNEDKIYLYLKS